MHLTPQQLTTLKAYILANPTLATQPSDGDGLGVIRDHLNGLSSPAFIGWKSNVSAGDIGNAWLGSDIVGMTSLNMQRLQLMLVSSPSGVFDMRRADRRAGFEDPFGSNANNGSRVAMRAVWKRTLTRLEKLFATGTGTDALPAITTIEGEIDNNEIDLARRS